MDTLTEIYISPCTKKKILQLIISVEITNYQLLNSCPKLHIEERLLPLATTARSTTNQRASSEACCA